jgi:hypothetical protein
VSPASAQNGESSGQWWWDTSLSIEQRVRQGSTDGRQTFRFRQNSLRAQFGLNGYIVHPAFAKFRVELSSRLDTYSGGGNQTNDAGFGFSIEGLRKSKTPFELYYYRQFQDVSESEDRPSSFAQADASKSWGGYLNLVDKIPGTVRLSLGHSEIEYAGDVPNETTDRRLVEWSGANQRSSQNFRVEQSSRDLARVGLAVDDLHAQFDTDADLGKEWGWSLNAVAVAQDTESSTGSSLSSESVRLFNRVDGPIGERLGLSLDLEAGRLSTDSNDSTDLLNASTRLKGLRVKRVQLTPSLQYGAVDSGDLRLSGPSLGLTAYWAGAEDSRISKTVGASLNYGTTRRETETEVTNNVRDGYALNGTLAFGEPSSLRTSMDLYWSMNEFRLDRDIDLGLIDRELLGAGLGTQDQLSGSLNLFKTWGAQNGKFWLRHIRLNSSSELSTAEISTRTTLAGADLNWGDVSWQSNLGRNESKATADVDESRVDYLSSFVTWRANRLLDVQARLRKDRTGLRLAASTDGFLLEATVRVRLGVLYFSSSIYKREQTYLDSTQQSHGFSFTIGGYYAEWLPIITGTRRRGIVR